jgi:hypothetical protein
MKQSNNIDLPIADIDKKFWKKVEKERKIYKKRNKNKWTTTSTS